MKKKLRRVKQCAKCPWKKSTDPTTIPDGYSPESHRRLESCIADPNRLELQFTQAAMACHESIKGEREYYCIGWLMHQLGPGNNIALRMRMRDYDLSKVELFGEQHETFKDTLPPR